MSPMRRELYGDGWEVFSERIRFKRAKGRCECRGECGSEHETAHKTTGRCPRRHGNLIPGGARKVILTTAHLCNDHACRDDSHVRAMCQRCHLNLDRHHHARNASLTRDRKHGQERLAV